MTNTYKIAVLLPTRGRTTALTNSIESLVTNCSDTANIQILLGLDRDDHIGRDYFLTQVKPYLDSAGVAYCAIEFEPMGYAGLNRYYNGLAKQSQADWLFVWNDDAVMNTQDWDQIITQHDGQFKLLKIHTHNEHPYSIFPIYPRKWYDLFGFLSRHQMIDAELSQIAYMLDLMQIVEIYANHDRADLTGNNKDETFKNKIVYEGNPSHFLDFHHPNFVKARMQDCETISGYLESNGHDMSFWHAVKTGIQDPWEKLRANDINKQCTQRTA
jgi:hypothetical protein